jgi:hypothetical protein
MSRLSKQKLLSDQKIHIKFQILLVLINKTKAFHYLYLRYSISLLKFSGIVQFIFVI